MFKSISTSIYFLILSLFLLFQSPMYQQEDQNQLQGLSIADEVKSRGVDLDYGKIPLYFIQNEGQGAAQSLFYAKTSKYSLWLTRNSMVFDIEWNGVAQPAAGRDMSTLSFLGAEKSPEVFPLDMAEYQINYFIGSDESKWRARVPTSKAILYQKLYPNIDLKVYGTENQIEYDWIIKPGGDVSDIRFLFEGVKETRIDEEQNLNVITNFSEFKHLKPVCCQFIAGARVPVEGLFKKIDNSTYGIEVEEYNQDYELIIDPIILVYSTFLGGTSYDVPEAIAVDSQGAVYITGITYSANFPTMNPIVDEFISTYKMAFVTKINSEGSGLVYSTFLGGSDDDRSYDLAIDSAGAAYIVGKAASEDFPLMNPFQADNKGSDDVFITKISPDGSNLVFSSFLGGTGQEWGVGIAVDNKGAAYVTGATTSADFPIKKAFQKKYKGAESPTYPWDCFISKIHPQGNRLVYSSFLGGNGFDFAKKVAVNSKSEAIITGDTSSQNFPTKKAVQKNISGMSDVFICKIHKSGRRLRYSTYLGGSDYENSKGIAVDSHGVAYVTGDTASDDFPFMNNLQELMIKDNDEEENDIFVIKLSANGKKILYSSSLGGSNYESVKDIAIDSTGAAYITGVTYSEDFPTLNPYQKILKGESDAFISKLSPNGKRLLYSTYLGGSSYDRGTGIAIDAQGIIYEVGETYSKNFPKKNAYQKKKRGKDSGDLFITKMEVH